MNNRREIRSALGITQMEMAGILGITRAQWSMYESGRRRLPFAALRTLGMVAQRLADGESSEGIEPKGLREVRLKHDRKRSQEVAYQLAVVEREWNAAYKKLNCAQQRKRVQDALVGEQGLHAFFVQNRRDTTEEKGLMRLVELQYRMDQLKAEQQLLHDRIRQDSKE